MELAKGAAVRTRCARERARPLDHEDSPQDDQGLDREKPNMTKTLLQYS